LCLPFLRRQIEIIRPRIIVTLGNVPTQALLGTAAGITKTRGAFVERGGILFMPTFHPAYLLRDPSKKKEVWEDMKKVWAKMKELGLRIGELKRR
jgi:DNA polymerase